MFDCVSEIDFLLEKYPEVSTTVEKFLRNFRASAINEDLEEGTDAVLPKKFAMPAPA